MNGLDNESTIEHAVMGNTSNEGPGQDSIHAHCYLNMSRYSVVPARKAPSCLSQQTPSHALIPPQPGRVTTGVRALHWTRSRPPILIELEEGSAAYLAKGLRSRGTSA